MNERQHTSFTILRRKAGAESAFSLVELLTASLVGFYIVAGTWATYMMGWQWWHEIAPRIEAQRVARLTLSYIIYGTEDSTAGSYTIGDAEAGGTFTRRNGISGAIAAPDIPSSDRINFRLDPDASNVRSFYMGDDDEDAARKVVYYIDNGGTVHRLDATSGITGLTLEKYDGNDDLIKVTATVEKSIVGVRGQPYTIKVVYEDMACLRNVS